MAGGGGGGPNGNGRHNRSYERENTVLINVHDNQRVKAKDVIDSLSNLLGEGVVYTCVAKASNIFEVTLADNISVRLASCGVTVGQNTFECTEVVQNSVVVSFMNMSGYIADADIQSKLDTLGVEIVGEIKRRLHPGTQVEDGTRYMRVKFPPNIKSLPYSMKFHNGKSWEHVRVIHNDQTKTCRQCLSTEHLFRDCPEFVCWKCGIQGHFSRLCREPRCVDCGKCGMKCECDTETLEDCPYCGKCACQCICCVWCDKPKQGCVCCADDICKFCSIELQNCQCIPCTQCGKLDCWCRTSTATDGPDARPDESVIGDDSTQVQAAENDGLDRPAVTGDQAGDQLAETVEPGHVINQLAANQSPETSAPVAEEGDQQNERSETVKENQSTEKDVTSNCGNKIDSIVPSIAEISKIVLYPGGSKSSLMRPPSSVPVKQSSDDVSRSLRPRRRRLVSEPCVSLVNLKKRNIDSNFDID